MNEKDFITIYTQILIINELNIDSKEREQLITSLLAEKQLKIADIEQTLNYLQKNPDKWADMILKIRNHMQQLQKETRSNIETDNENPL